jgi:hypothetical protein
LGWRVSGKRPPIDPRRVVVPIFRARQGKGVDLRATPPPEVAPQRRPARVAHMLALAIRIEKMIESGELKDRAHAAANLGFTRARLTQILALTLLAPDIQEEILFLEVDEGVERITERALRDIVSIDDWREQRRRWQRLLAAAPSTASRSEG